MSSIPRTSEFSSHFIMKLAFQKRLRQSHQFCSCRYYLRPSNTGNYLPSKSGLRSHNEIRTPAAIANGKVSNHARAQWSLLSAALEFKVGLWFRKSWKTLKLKIAELTQEWLREWCQFQVAIVHRLVGVLGTDRHTYALSVLYHRWFKNEETMLYRPY